MLSTVERNENYIKWLSFFPSTVFRDSHFVLQHIDLRRAQELNKVFSILHDNIIWFFFSGYPIHRGNQNFHYKPRETSQENLKLTWDSKNRRFICSSREPKMLAMQAISCQNPNSCELLQHCFGGVRTFLFTFSIRSHVLRLLNVRNIVHSSDNHYGSTLSI